MAGGGYFDRPEPTLHALDRPPGRAVPCALLFRHRPIAGAALSWRRLTARKPARSDVQCAPEDSDAVSHPSARGVVVRLLPIRTSAAVLQSARMAASRARPGSRRIKHSGKTICA